MTVKAGSIITVAGHTVIQRLQTQGLTNVKIPVATIREIGNDLVVDKVPQEPDFTFSMESLAVDCSIEAILHGKVATGSGATQGAGATDPAGTEYKWETSQAINICSPWKDPQSFSSGNVAAGHLIPGYYPQKMSYKFGVTENAAQTAELRGGIFYYGNGMAPTEDVFTGTNGTQVYTTAHPGVQYRRSGVLGTTFKNALAVLVNGVLKVEGEDYTVSGGGAVGSNTDITVTFTNYTVQTGDQIRVAYFTTDAEAYPDAVHESSLVLPGAVRGRNICLSVASGGAQTWQRVYGVQTFTLDAAFDITPERELCNDELVGFTVNGTDTTGAVTLHAKDFNAFFAFLKQMTGVNTLAEVVGWLNLNPLRVKVEIMDPRNAGTVLKTLYVEDAIFDIPGTPARVNAVVDFQLTYESLTGTYSAFKGAANV
jgi:hypothetical protein